MRAFCWLCSLAALYVALISSSLSAADVQDDQARIDVIRGISPAVVTVLDPNGAGGGSGVLIDPAGYGLTNFHVIASLMEHRAGVGGLSDGKTYPLSVLGIDPTGDLAMFRLEGRERFDCVSLGDSDLVQVGDPVMAMGNPFLLAEDYTPTVTCGIVSGVHRYQGGAAANQLVYTDSIQVDASINPGNSGGPLFDMRGRLIGINGRAAFEERNRVNVGLGFAITINQVRRFIPYMRAGLLTEHGTLNATVKDAGRSKVVFDRLLEDSVAYLAGIRSGDRLLRFGGVTIQSANQFASVQGTFPSNWPVDVEYANKDGRRTVSVRLHRLPLQGLPPFEPDEKVNREAVRHVLSRYIHQTATNLQNPERKRRVNAIEETARNCEAPLRALTSQTMSDDELQRWSHLGGDAVLVDAANRVYVVAEVLQCRDQDPPVRYWFDTETYELLWAVRGGDPSAIIASERSVAASTQPAANPMFTMTRRVLPSLVKLYGGGASIEHGYGAGVIVSTGGEVVTALSLLLEGENIRAVAPDGSVYPVSVLYRDEDRQLALLRMQGEPPDGGFAAMPPGSSKELRAGDPVLALGNPFKVAEGEERMSLMKGVLSQRGRLDARHRARDIPYRGEVLFVDAVTGNPGSSGGALLDSHGNWVGLIGKSVYSSLTQTRLNYAMPIEEVMVFVADARSPRNSGEAATKPASRPAGIGYHGIRLFSLAYRQKLPFVERVDLGSPAERAGVRKEDLVVSANGVPVASNRVFDEVCSRLRPGDELVLVLKRGEQLITVEMKLEALR